MDFSNLKEALGNYLIKGVAAALAGESLHELAGGGHIFGKVIYFGFAQSVPAVEFVDRQYITSELFRTWGGEIGSALLAQLLNTKGLLLVLALLLLLAHVLLKREALKTREGNIMKYGWVGRIYCRFYFRITMIFLIFFLFSLFTATTPFSILAYFLLIALPATIYLLYNSIDLIKGDFAEQFTYVTTVVIMGFALVALPYNYGRRVFDVKLYSIEPLAGMSEIAPHSLLFRCGENQIKNDQGTKNQLLCDIRQEDTRLIIRFLETSEGQPQVSVSEVSILTLLAKLSDKELRQGLFGPSRPKELPLPEQPVEGSERRVQDAAEKMLEMIQ